MGKMLENPHFLLLRKIFSKASFLRAINPFPNDKYLDASKLKEFADDNFNFGESGEKLSKRIENTVGKGEIARYEQFLLFPQCFLKTCTADTQEGHDGPEIAHLSLLTKHAPSSFPVT